MNKKMRELLEQIEVKTKKAKEYSNGEDKDLDKAAAALDEVDELKKAFEVEKRLYEANKEKNTPTDVELDEEKKQKEKKDSVKAFADAARAGFPRNKAMSEGSADDGGYTVPEDIQTRIVKRREAKASLLDLVRVVHVTTNKGQRTFKKRVQQTGFSKVGEGGKIAKKDTPKFERISYEIEKYAGYFPVTNELLEDSDAQIVSELTEWIGDESRVTANKLILAAIAKKTAVEFRNVDDMKKAKNVDLGSAFNKNSVWVTNDDGLQYLDTLKDEEGKYLLQPDVKDDTQFKFLGLKVKVFPNEDMPTNNKKIPLHIGDFKEGIVYWDRKQTTIKVSDVAVIGDLNAFEEDLTLFRAIEREDVTQWDDKAFINGYVKATE